MESTVCFRDFEERDIDFVYRCKNNEKLWEHTVGEFHEFSYAEAVEWVHACMRDDLSYKFWAICKNDETGEIVGWNSISDIDYEKRSATAYGVVIGNPEYNDGIAAIESAIFISHYVFEVLNFDVLNARYLADYYICEYNLLFAKISKIEKNAVCKKGKYHDVVYTSSTKKDYFSNLALGYNDVDVVIKKLVQFRKTKMINY